MGDSFSGTPDRVRILVLGDSDVGKSSLVHLLCKGEVLWHPSRTIGCNVDVVLHTYPKVSQPCAIEFMDVGGSIRQDRSIGVFFRNIDGIMLVHDANNRKSYKNLWQWLAIYHSQRGTSRQQGGPHTPSPSVASNPSVDALQMPVASSWPWPLKLVLPAKAAPNFDALSSMSDAELMDSGMIEVPILLVGNKADLLSAEQTARPRRYSITQEFRCNSITMSSKSGDSYTKHLGSLNDFFNSVIEHKRGTGQRASSGESSRGMYGNPLKRPTLHRAPGSGRPAMGGIV